jgi:hypothetical protein
MYKNTEIPRLNSIERPIFRLVKPYLQTRNNELHTQNAIEFAFRLLKIYKGERDVIIPAIILHDAGWSKVPEEIIKKTRRPRPDKNLLRIHEEESLKIARDILEKVSYDSIKTAEILGIIDGHDSRDEALSVNDQIVKDADKLTRYAVNFWFLARRVPVTLEEFAKSLEQLIEPWFFLEDSKEIARMELSRRLTERDN